jgi:hypothetical protein
MVAPVEANKSLCPECGQGSVRIPSCPKISLCNEDAAWIRETVRMAVDPETKDRQEQALYKNPTRTEMNRWLDAKGLQVSSKGDMQKRKKQPDDGVSEATIKKLADMQQKRHAITLTSA